MGGRIRNLGKLYILQLVVCVCTNELMSPSGISLCRSAMIQTGLSRDMDGQCRESQLRTELQQNCNSYPENFQGKVQQRPEV